MFLGLFNQSHAGSPERRAKPFADASWHHQEIEMRSPVSAGACAVIGRIAARHTATGEARAGPAAVTNDAAAPEGPAEEG